MPPKSKIKKYIIQNRFFYIVAIIYLTIIATYFLILGFHGNMFYYKSTDWGTFGDFVGGVTNPIIALAVLFYVSKSYFSQRKELLAVEDEMKKQRKISVFGEFLTFYRSENEILKNAADENNKELLKLEEIVIKQKEQKLGLVPFGPGLQIDIQIRRNNKKISDLKEVQKERLKYIGYNRDKISEYIQKLEDLVN